MTRRADRTSDVRILSMLSMRAQGFTWAAIGTAFGITPMAVRLTCRKVRNADVAENGEQIAEAYP